MVRWLVLAAILGGVLHAETVLVVPLFNHSKSANLGWIGESIAEAVQDSLASQGLLVLSREDRLEAYSRQSLRPGAEITHASIIKIAESLDASDTVYGYYELLPAAEGSQSRGSLRITVRLLDLKHTRQSAPFIEMGALEDLAAVQARVEWQVLELLAPQSTPPEAEFLKDRPAVRLDALESYVRGLLATSPEQSLRFLLQAARLDEHYSQPCFQLGKIYWARKDYKSAENWLARVSRTGQHYFEAQFFLGLSRYHDGDFAGAEEAFQIVANAFPLNEVYNDLGAAEARRKNFPAAVASFRKAIEGDSSDPDYHYNLGCALVLAGDSAAAVTSFRAAVERNAGDSEATLMLGRALGGAGAGAGATDAKAAEHLRLKTDYEEGAYRQLQAELKK